jgi:hypothetical protein
MGGLAIFIVSPENGDEAARLIRAHVEHAGLPIGSVFAPPSAVASVQHDGWPTVLPLDELVWPPEGDPKEPILVISWSTDAIEGIETLLGVAEMEPRSAVVIACDPADMAPRLATAIMLWCRAEKDAPPSEILRTIDSATIPGGGCSFLIRMT